VLALLAGGCSSVSVTGEREDAALAPTAPPPAVYVHLFEVPDGAEFEVATPNKGEDARLRVGQLIADGIFTRSSRWIAPGRVAGEGEKLPASGLLIDGRLLRAQQGSRALRLGIGFGLGRSHLDTSVRVFNLAKSADKPWLTFNTTGGSNMEPGLAAALVTAPISAPIVALPAAASVASGAVSTASRGFKGVTQDGKRTGRAIAAQPMGTVQGRLRITEQGEVVSSKYANRGTALNRASSVERHQLVNRWKAAAISRRQVPGASARVCTSKPSSIRLERLATPRSVTCSGG
jgi:hypothetical protein